MGVRGGGERGEGRGRVEWVSELRCEKGRVVVREGGSERRCGKGSEGRWGKGE